MAGTRGDGNYLISVRNGGNLVFHSDKNHFAVVKKKSQRCSGCGNVNAFAVAYRVFNGKIGVDVIEFCASASDEFSVFVNTVYTVVCKCDFNQFTVFLARFDNGGKVGGGKSVVAPGIYLAVFHKNGGYLLTAEKLFYFGRVNFAVGRKFIGHLTAHGYH